jgi:uncharacterized SAM-binding protein YcdF (DUF218 family)
VVLSAGVIGEGTEGPGPLLKDDTARRCRYGAWLWKRSPQLPVLVCGGPIPFPMPAAALMRQAMVEQGVPETMVWTEARSRSTFENANFAAQILRSKGIGRIVLVTEAYHMLRRERCFRKQGLDVIPAHCNFSRVDPVVNDWVPDGEAVLINERALHEFIGLGWYLVRGKI